MALKPLDDGRRVPGRRFDCWVGRTAYLQGVDRVTKGGKSESPMRLGLPFEKASLRFIQTKPDEMSGSEKEVARAEAPAVQDQAESGQPRKCARTNSWRPKRNRQ